MEKNEVGDKPTSFFNGIDKHFDRYVRKNNTNIGRLKVPAV